MESGYGAKGFDSTDGKKEATSEGHVALRGEFEQNFAYAVGQKVEGPSASERMCIDKVWRET